MTEQDSGTAGVAAQCRAEGGLIEVELGVLREELGYKKLGKWVLVEIAEALEKAKLGFFPQSTLDPVRNTELRQWQTVWIYDRDGSPRAQMIDAVLAPERHDVRAALDGLAAGHTAALTPEQKLDRIRALVTD